MSTDEINPKLYCYRHPERETLLRCNRCDQPICITCAVKTPTGYRCGECVRSQQKIFDTAEWTDYTVTMILAALLSFAGSYLTALLGFFTIIIAPVVGMLIAEAVRRILKKRRSKKLFQWITFAAILGSVPILLTSLLGLVFALGGSGNVLFSGLLPLVWRGLYTFLVASTVFYRLSGIRL